MSHAQGVMEQEAAYIEALHAAVHYCVIEGRLKLLDGRCASRVLEAAFVNDTPRSDWYIVNVEAAIFRDGRYLMIVRGPEESHAPGGLSLVGGKVENAGSTSGILEATLRREVREEVAVELEAEIEYLESNAFVADDGEPVVDVVFLCRYASGTPAIADPGEVAGIQWMTPEQILADPAIPPWTRQSIECAEQVRRAKGW